MKKYLFVCGTQLHVIDMLSILDHDLDPDAVYDVLLGPNLFSDNCWSKILRDRKYFRYIFLIDPLYRLAYSNKRILLSRILRSKVKATIRDFFKAIRQPKDEYKIIVNYCTGGEFDITQYQKVYFGSIWGGGILTTLYKTLRRLNKGAKSYLLDDGVGSYYIGSSWTPDESVQGLFLFSPELCHANIKKIRISSIDGMEHKKTLSIIDKYFKCKKIQLPKIVFFDQMIALPSFDSQSYDDKWKKTSYMLKKIEHLKIVSSLYRNSLEVKLHPSTNIELVSKFYNTCGLKTFSKNINLPFELLFHLSNVRPQLLITVSSSAVVMPLLMTSHRVNVHICILWNLYKDLPEVQALGNNDSTSIFFNELQRRFPANVFMPKNEKEFLNYLNVSLNTKNTYA